MTRARLEAALRRDPHDEQAWSVFGDLLAAEGDSRGELIALVQRAAACERPFERSVLEHQAEDLFRRDHRRWLGPLADAGLEVRWLRGFVTSVEIDRKHPSTLAALLQLPTAALLRTLVLVRPRRLAPLVAQLREHHLTRLVLRAPTGQRVASVEPLAELTQLRELEVVGGTSVGVEALASLPELNHLSLRRFEGGLAGLGEGFAALRSLELTARDDAAELGDDALEPLAHFAALRELSLRDGGWSRVEALAGLAALERLDLRSTGVSELAPLAGLHSLRELELGGCTELTNIEALASLRALERLDLAYTRVRRLQPLASATQLRVLELAGTPVQDLLPLVDLEQLRKIGLEACEVDPPRALLDRGISLVGYRPPEPSWRELATRALRETRSS